jgi:hypothetical protein
MNSNTETPNEPQQNFDQVMMAHQSFGNLHQNKIPQDPLTNQYFSRAFGTNSFPNNYDTDFQEKKICEVNSASSQLQI